MINRSISFKSKFGWITAFERDRKLRKISFEKKYIYKPSKTLLEFKKNINNFFLHKTDKITANYSLDGSIVQKKVWLEIKKIKSGTTKSYGEIARKLHLSPRHVGKICSENMLLLLIPCHRVVRSDGKLGGFSAKGGIYLKKQLLDFEKMGCPR
ncbi:MAG: hypothetical protein CMI95_03965 [Pelagibacteraceae bacterium]|nr:hypothetical protein [Pelagibacteraceae bacterium]PPR51234.1 MAG: Methylated-DNA--protein-cysteine methyltransferase [Alphaproteobacteria bacterium MarineAlpha5_Bin10]|tara:strand:- start:776 stop:1237 length:462 start_codon:yes stop_codon:yes gene_type:complete